MYWWYENLQLNYLIALSCKVQIWRFIFPLNLNLKYELFNQGETLASGSITKDLQEKINSATMENAPDDSELEEIEGESYSTSDPSRRKRANAPDDSELEEIEGESYSTSDPSRRKKAIRDWFSRLQSMHLN